MKRNFRYFLCISVLFLVIGTGLYAQSEGEKLFIQNRPGEAVVVLESEIASGIASSVAYNYVGLCYYQLGEYEKAVEAFGVGLKTSGTNKKVLAFNQGNAYYALGKYEDAAKCFNLAYSADSNYVKALLNRANAYLMADNLKSALSDYQLYISTNPFDEQSESIKAMIAAIQSEIERRVEEEKLAAEEAERIAEEERKLAEEMERQRIEAERVAEEKRKKEEARLAEERRIEEERIAEERRIEAERKAAEAERRRKLLEDVANSLHNTDSTNMSSGAEELLEYEQESELD